MSEFIKKVALYAVTDMKKTGVLASLTLAQAILESSWGKSGLAIKGNNLFGIKGSYNGQFVTMPTKEWSKSKGWYTIDAAFRKYPSYAESIADHSKLFMDGPSWDRNHYKPVIQAKNYKEAAQAVQKCGYATDPDYANKLIKLIEDYKLYQYDGQTVAPTSQTSKQADKSGVYIVRSGDTFSGIAAKYGFTVQEMAQASGIKNANVIKIGQKIKIPSKTITYTVKSGDYLGKIAALYGVSVDKIARDNNIQNKNLIKVGQKIKIIK